MIIEEMLVSLGFEIDKKALANVQKFDNIINQVKSSLVNIEPVFAKVSPSLSQFGTDFDMLVQDVEFGLVKVNDEFLKFSNSSVLSIFQRINNDVLDVLLSLKKFKAEQSSLMSDLSLVVDVELATQGIDSSLKSLKTNISEASNGELNFFSMLTVDVLDAKEKILEFFKSIEDFSISSINNIISMILALKNELIDLSVMDNEGTGGSKTSSVFLSNLEASSKVGQNAANEISPQSSGRGSTTNNSNFNTSQKITVEVKGDISGLDKKELAAEIKKVASDQNRDALRNIETGLRL